MGPYQRLFEQQQFRTFFPSSQARVTLPTQPCWNLTWKKDEDPSRYRESKGD
jgi:hypothetical protein